MAFCTNCGKALPESGVCACRVETMPVPPPAPVTPPAPAPEAQIAPPVPPVPPEQPVQSVPLTPPPPVQYPSPVPPAQSAPPVPPAPQAAPVQPVSPDAPPVQVPETPPAPAEGASYPPPDAPPAPPYPPGYPPYPPQQGGYPPPNYQPPPPRPPSPFMEDLKAVLRTYFSPGAEAATLVASQRASRFWLLILGVNALLTALCGMVIPIFLGQTLIHGAGVLIAFLFFVIDYVIFVGVFYALFALTKRKIPFQRFVAAVTTAQLVWAPLLALSFVFGFFWPSSQTVLLVLGHVAVCLHLYCLFRATPPTQPDQHSPFWAIVLAMAVFLLLSALFGILREQWLMEIAAENLFGNMLGELGDLFGGLGDAFGNW